MKTILNFRTSIIRLCTSYTISKSRLEVCTVNVQKQIVSADRGLFALAYVVELCLGNNPATMAFEQSSMRRHYDSCIANRLFNSFENKARSMELNYKVHKFNKTIN